MTFFQALYGVQHRDLVESGRDGRKGRMYGNLFLTAYIIILFFALLMTAMLVFPSLHKSLALSLHHLFGYSFGKTLGKIVAVPLMAVIYIAVANTVGSAHNYDRLAQEFSLLPEKDRLQANKKLLIPFFLLLGIFLALALRSLV